MGLDYILYRREALGKDGRKIRVYKFRTMELDAEHSWSSVVSANGRDELGKPINDPRLTRIGKTLRRYWIDEIPQLYNIIISRDMSLVGIRPRPEEDWSLLPEGYKESALKHKPGLMGVNYARLNSSLDEMMESESQYLDKKEEHPLLTDIEYFFRILYQIIFRGLRSK